MEVLYIQILIPDNCKISFITSVFQENIANFLGGGIFLQNYKISEFFDMELSNNFAVFMNQSNNSNMSSPFYINITYLQVAGDIEYFFDEINQTEYFTLNNFHKTNINISIYDANNNLYDYENTSTVTWTAFDPTITIIQPRKNVEKGIINFDSFEIQGRVNETFAFQIELQGKFNLKKNITFFIRPCKIGEFYMDTQFTCEICPLGTFSLDLPKVISQNPFKQENINICKKCPANAECKEAKIVPNVDFWIGSSNFTTEIVKCPFSGTCLYQPFDSFTKPVNCQDGYEGPLCIVCDAGYAKDGYLSKCEKCKWEAREVLIFLGKGIFIILFVSYQIKSALFSTFKKDLSITGILIKIIRDHFNQIYLIYSFCSLFQLNTDYKNAYDTVNTIITGSALNFNCFYNNDEGLDIFYFQTISYMLSPLILHICVSLAFLMLFLLQKLILKKKILFLTYLKTVGIAFIVICETQYTQILISCLKLFECVKIDSLDPNSYLVYAPTIQCYSDDHIDKFLKIGLPSLIIWIFGLPFMFFLVLFIINHSFTHKSSLMQIARETKKSFSPVKAKTSVLEKEKEKSIGIFEAKINAAAMFSFLFYDYKDDKYYWTSVIMIWKSVLSILITFLKDDELYMSVFAVYVLMIWIYLQGNPYSSDISMLLVKVSFFCNVSTVILGQYAKKNQEFNDLLVILNLLIHLCFFVLAFIIVIKEYDYKGVFFKILAKLEQKKSNKFVKTSSIPN